MSVTEPDIIPPDTGGIPPDAISRTPEERTYVILTLTPLPGVDVVVATRQGLKRLLRSHGLRCTNIEARGWPGIVPLPKNLPEEAK